jgi:GTP-binding protein
VEDPQSRLKELQEEVARKLPQVRGAPMVALSAETGRNLDRLMPAVFKAHRDWSTKVKTRDLNDWLAMAVQRHPPPAVNGRRVKPKYIAQTKARPPTFVLFASRASQLPDSYRRYLINSIRESFDLPGVPVRLTVKSGANPYADGEGASRGPSKTAPRKAKPSGAKASGAKAGAGKSSTGKKAAPKSASPAGRAKPARPAAKRPLSAKPRPGRPSTRRS